MKSSIIATALLAGLGFVAAAHADNDMKSLTDSQHILVVKGKIVGQTCQINFDTSDHTVTLDTVRTDQINSAAATAFKPKPFNIALKGCSNTDEGTNQVALHFAGTTGSPADPDGNFQNHGDAKNVAVQILEADGTTQVKADQDSKSFKIAQDGTAKVSYKAAYYSKAGSVTPGNVEAESAITVSYQ